MAGGTARSRLRGPGGSCEGVRARAPGRVGAAPQAVRARLPRRCGRGTPGSVGAGPQAVWARDPRRCGRGFPGGAGAAPCGQPSLPPGVGRFAGSGSPLVGGSAPSLCPFSVSVSAGVAHKGGNWATLGRTQGLDSALVCGVCFLNRGPCVRTPRGWCAIRSSPPGVWAWCGRAPGAAGVVGRVHVDRVRSALGLSAGAPLGCGRALSARVRIRGRVVDTDARCRHREGVVDIVRGLLTPRGGYNARWCQQRASVPISHADCQQRASVRTGRAHADNARRRPRPEPSSAVTAVGARGHTRQSPQPTPGATPGSHRSPRPGPSSAVTAAHARGHPAAEASKKAAAATRRCRPQRARAPGRRRRRGAPRRAPRAPGPRCPRPPPLPCS